MSLTDKELVELYRNERNMLAVSLDREMTDHQLTTGQWKYAARKLEEAVKIIKELQAIEGVPHLDDHFEFLNSLNNPFRRSL